MKQQPKTIQFLQTNDLVSGLVRAIINETKSSNKDWVILKGPSPYITAEISALVGAEYCALKREGKHNGPAMALLPDYRAWDNRDNVHQFEVTTAYLNSILNQSQDEKTLIDNKDRIAA